MDGLDLLPRGQVPAPDDFAVANREDLPIR
jgi:hypothetical protein